MQSRGPLMAWLHVLFGVTVVLARVGDDAQQPLIDSTTDDTLFSSGQIILYPGSRIHPKDLESLGKKMTPCPADSSPQLQVKLDLELNTCLSGEYYLRDNFEITRLPKCADQSTPLVFFYRNRRCGGIPEVIRKGDRFLNRCLWSERDGPYPSYYYWSMIMACSSPATPPHIAKHEVATTHIAHQITVGVHAETAVFEAGKSCGGVQKPYIFPMKVDNCHISSSEWKPHDSLKILNPAICPNGTRARLAILEDTGKRGKDSQFERCHWGQVTLERGLVDIHDDNIGHCLPVSRFTNSYENSKTPNMNITGIMFYCNGLDTSMSGYHAPKPEETTDAVVSHTECGTQTWHNLRSTHSKADYRERRPVTWMNVPAFTCVDIHHGQSLHVHKHPAGCAGGYKRHLATWTAPGCKGEPDRRRHLRDGLTGDCETFHGPDGSGSYMFSCDGTSYF